MKQIKFLLTIACLLFTGMMQAQTFNDIVTEVLSKLPAQTIEEYNDNMTKLVSTGEDGILDLINRLNDVPEGESNASMLYAISGWSHFVALDSPQRAIAANALEKALGKDLDKEVKAFVIRQLRTIGTNDNIGVLTNFLADDYLCDPAAQALVSIGTDESLSTLLNVLDGKPEHIKKHVINALGQARYSKALPKLENLLKQDSTEDLKEVIVNAINHINSSKSRIPNSEPNTLSESEVKDGFRLLFDGKNLDQWQGNKDNYTVVDGNIVLDPTRGSGGNLYTNEEFANFVLRFEFLLSEGTNNGIGIRTPLLGDPAYVGMELQILDNTAPRYQNLRPHQFHGSIYGVIPAKKGFLKPVGEWNYQEIIADGYNIKVILNGTTILDGNVQEASKNGTLDKREHPGLLNEKGHIGFLGHGTKIRFRSVRIKEL